MAEWKIFEYDTPQCSHCGAWMPFARYRKGNGTNARNITDFCPDCGAKMRAMPLCNACTRSDSGGWKDDGICFDCRGQVWVPNKPHSSAGMDAPNEEEGGEA